MYPLTDYPHFEESFDTFAAMRACIEAQDEGLNQIQSWLIIPEGDSCLDPGQAPEFHVAIFMPRLTKVTAFSTTRFDIDQVQQWLNDYVLQRVMRWYGFALTPEWARRYPTFHGPVCATREKAASTGSVARPTPIDVRYTTSWALSPVEPIGVPR